MNLFLFQHSTYMQPPESKRNVVKISMFVLFRSNVKYNIEEKYTVNQRLLVSATHNFYVTSFFMFSDIHLHVMSQCHDVTLTLIAIQFDSLCPSCRFLKTGFDHMGVLQTPIKILCCISIFHILDFYLLSKLKAISAQKVFSVVQHHKSI